jgi:hypothetical protein
MKTSLRNSWTKRKGADSTVKYHQQTWSRISPFKSRITSILNLQNIILSKCYNLPPNSAISTLTGIFKLTWCIVPNTFIHLFTVYKIGTTNFYFLKGDPTRRCIGVRTGPKQKYIFYYKDFSQLIFVTIGPSYGGITN